MTNTNHGQKRKTPMATIIYNLIAFFIISPVFTLTVAYLWREGTITKVWAWAIILANTGFIFVTIFWKVIQELIQRKREAR